MESTGFLGENKQGGLHVDHLLLLQVVIVDWTKLEMILVTIKNLYFTKYPYT